MHQESIYILTGRFMIAIKAYPKTEGHQGEIIALFNIAIFSARIIEFCIVKTVYDKKLQVLDLMQLLTLMPYAFFSMSRFFTFTVFGGKERLV